MRGRVGFPKGSAAWGKKGKGKKSKITGTPDVVKFKQTREFYLLKECVSIQESLPYVASEPLDDVAFKKVVGAAVLACGRS